MKKLVSLLLAGAMVFSLAACSSTEKTEGTASVEQNDVENTTQENEEVKDTASKENSDESLQDTPSVVTVKNVIGDKELSVEVPFNPQKVAVLDLAALDNMDALGLADRIVGVPKSSSVSYLTAYIENENITDLGSVKEVNMEALNSAEPDLIIIGGRLSEQYEALSQIAPTILLKIDHEAGYMNTFKENLEKISSIFGLENKYEETVSGFETRIAALNEAAQGKTAIVGLVTSGSMNILGEASRCSLISNEAGFENAAEEVDSTHGDNASFELVLDKNPDYVFVLDRDTSINAEGAKTAKEVMENEIIMKTDAYQNGNIVYLTPDVWYLSEGGITATDTMISDLEGGVIRE